MLIVPVTGIATTGGASISPLAPGYPFASQYVTLQHISMRHKWLSFESCKAATFVVLFLFISFLKLIWVCFLQKVEFVWGVNVTERWVRTEGWSRGEQPSLQLKLWSSIRGESVYAQKCSRSRFMWCYGGHHLKEDPLNTTTKSLYMTLMH